MPLRSAIDCRPTVARIISGLTWDFETISAVNPRRHLSRELSLLSFFPHIQRRRLLGTGSAPFYLSSLSSSLAPSISLPSLLPFIPLAIGRREERDRETNVGRGAAGELISARFGRDGTKRFLRRASRTNELSFRIVNLPRNEMKRWNDILAPFSAVFTGARASPTPTTGVDVNDWHHERELASSLPSRATSDNYFYGLSYEDRNGKYEDRSQSLIFSLRERELMTRGSAAILFRATTT